MSVRRAEYARLQAAGWTVVVDSPWRRLAAAVARLMCRRVDSDTSATGGVPGAAGGWSR
jgi:hypothetical protein